MIENYYIGSKDQSCVVLLTIQPTLRISSWHVFSEHDFYTADRTLLCVKGLNGKPKYYLSSLDVDEVHFVKCLILHSCFVQKYEFISMCYFDLKNPVYNHVFSNPGYLAGLPLGTMTMSIAGSHTNHYTNPSYLAGLPLGKMTMSIAGGQTNQHTINLSCFVGMVNTINASDYKPAEQSFTEEFSNLTYFEDIGNSSDLHSISKLLYSLYQRCTCLNGISSCNLCGGMYSPSEECNLPWSVLENKLALIGRVPYDTGSSPGDCFFASLGHSLYKDPNCHFQIRSAGIAHLVSNPELYIESLSGISWENYIRQMSQPGTWCDNIIMQAVANALGCTMHITDSSQNSNATILSPFNLEQRQKIAFLGYINGIHYVSTLPNTITGNERDNKRKETMERSKVYARKKRVNETGDAKKLQLEKMAAYRQSHNIGQSQYLSEFDFMKNGPLHEQSWAKCNMQQFHKSVQYSVCQCTVCKEVWPIKSKPKFVSSYVCLRCSRDKNNPKKFSDGNSMIPGPVPTELQGLTQTEEMLIARALPIMRVYVKPHGQRGYSGHCVNLPQHIEELASVLPRYTSDLSVIVINMKGRNNTFKDVTVRREKVHNALTWLVRNNPHYKSVTINQHALELLPINGIPSDITTVESDSDILSEEMTLPDIGPPTDNDEDKVYNQSTEMSSFLPACEKHRLEVDAIKNQLFPNNQISWPTVDNQPINEYQTPFLATLAFPTLFPDGTGDPTNPAIVRDIPLGEKIKHLIKFAEHINGKWIYRFASHPRFSYWSFNMLQRKRVLQQSGIFLKQNPGEAHLTIDELLEMAGNGNNNTFISKISRYVANIAGSNAYWYKVREDLKAIVTTVGAPTFFFTFSSADMHWPDLHKLFGNENSTSEERRQSVINNPHIVDWFFTQKLESFIKHWLYKTLDAKWHWYRFEYQSRGSIHCHGIAKLNNDPGLCDLTKIALKGYLAEKLRDKNQQINTSDVDEVINAGKKAAKVACQYVDWMLSTVHPNEPDDMWVKPNIHPCQKLYQNIPDCDMHADYCDLLNMVQRHTRCSTGYCLRKKPTDSELKCRFNFPIKPCPSTRLEFEEIHTKGNENHYRAKIVTKRNDSRLNNNQQLQLQSWRANCDIQVVIDHYACVEYLTKYAAKSEPRNSVLKAAFNTIMNNVPRNSNPHNAIKKVVMRTIGQRDYAAQETMHHLLTLKLHSSSFTVIPVSLNGSRRINTSTAETDVCSSNSLLDVYANRAQYNFAKDTAKLNFVQFATQFKVVNNKLTRLPDNVIPRIFPTYSCNPTGPNFAQYCKYQLLRYKPWQIKQENAWDNEEPSDGNMINKWQEFLQKPYAKENVPDWFDKLQSAVQNQHDPDDQLTNEQSENTREEWMIISDLHTPFVDTLATNLEPAYEWTIDRANFSEEQIAEMPSWIKNMKNMNDTNSTITCDQNIDLNTFSEMQELAYNIVTCHFNNTSVNKDSLALIINGVAGTGKSYLINAIRTLLSNKCAVTATTGKAAFNINGVTVHSLLKLPVGSRGNKDLTGQNLIRLQESLTNIDYIIIDEYSMLGQLTFGWIDRRLKQTTGLQDKLLGGKSVILCGDPGQLPPVADKPLYHAVPSNNVGEQGHLTYMMFDNVVKLNVNQRVQGNNPEQTRFRELLLRLRKGESTVDDWELLLTRQPANIDNLSEFNDAIRLFFSNVEVANYNHEQLIKLQEPVAQITARHSNATDKRISSDEFSGLEPLLFLAKRAKIMLTMNLWPEVGLCNGATGTVVHFIYENGHQPPHLPLAVIVKFDNYRGPSINQTLPSCVPICPITVSAQLSDGVHERQQLPLKLAWAITIHKSQGLTLPKAWINIGKAEKTPGLTYVAISRVKALSCCIIEPFTYERLASIKSSKMLQYRLKEEDRLAKITQATLHEFHKTTV